ncbi:hypothetical protein D3C75_1144390 [compost metagenome]
MSDVTVGTTAESQDVLDLPFILCAGDRIGCDLDKLDQVLQPVVDVIDEVGCR